MIYEFQGEHRWLSNFWPCEIMYEGLLFPSTENAYQAAKTLILKERWIFQAIRAGDAKQRGKALNIRPDWEQVKLDVMLHLLRLKFQHPDLRAKLLATGNEELQEGNKWHDTFWGVYKGRGQNHLGRLLMQVREEIRQV